MTIFSFLDEHEIPYNNKDLIDQAFAEQVNRYLVNFIKLLCDKGLLREFSGCCEEFTRRYNQDNNIAEAVVTSAVPLSEAQSAALREKLSAMSGKKVHLVLKTDPRMIAGIRVELEGKQLDGTAKGRLDGMRKAIGGTMV